MDIKTLEEYRNYVVERLAVLTPILANATTGDFSQDVPIPQKEDLFSQLYVGMQLMLEVIREKIAELNHLNRVLQQRVEERTALLKSIGDGIVVTDVEGKITFLNDKAEKMLGWKTAEVLNKPWSDISPMVDDEGKPITSINQPAHKVLTFGKPIAFRNYYMRKDKTLFPVAATVTPVFSNERINGMIAVFRDITKEKEIDEMKSDFISIAAHQLRTPLGTIRWQLETLLGFETIDKDKLNDRLHKMYASDLRMIELVNSLLSISHLESGKLVIEPKLLIVKDLVTNVINELQTRIAAKNQTMHAEISDNIPTISADPKLLRQIYQNLLTNASKYSSSGQPIDIRVYVKDNELVSEISDYGYGIPDDEKIKVFQRFFRGKNIVKYEPDGTGLGLYLVKKIIESSNGHIWFESKEGKGTTFFFTLPI